MSNEEIIQNLYRILTNIDGRLTLFEVKKAIREDVVRLITNFEQEGNR